MIENNFIKERNQRYYEKNREALILKNKENYRKNRTEILEKSKNHRIDNLEKYRKLEMKRYEKRFYGTERKVIFKRDEYKCVLCGSNKKLCVHHKDGNGYSNPPKEKNNKICNLMTLCFGCHARIHYQENKNKINFAIKDLWKKRKENGWKMPEDHRLKISNKLRK